MSQHANCDIWLHVSCAACDLSVYRLTKGCDLAPRLNFGSDFITGCDLAPRLNFGSDFITGCDLAPRLNFGSDFITGCDLAPRLNFGSDFITGCDLAPRLNFGSDFITMYCLLRVSWHYSFILVIHKVDGECVCVVSVCVFIYVYGGRCSSVVRAFVYGTMGRQIDPSWWTHWAIFCSSQCSMNGVI